MAPRIATKTDKDILKQPGDPQVSPDQQTIAFVLNTSKDEQSKTTIQTIPVSGGQITQVTSGEGSDRSPRWSPDGQSLAFLSNRGETAENVYVDDWEIKTRTPSKEFQIYLLPVNGGEAIQITAIEGGVVTPRNLDPFIWSSDGNSIAFLSTDQLTSDEKQRLENKDDPKIFEQNPKYTRLYVVDLETTNVRCVSPKSIQVWEFAWSKIHNDFAIVSSDLPFEGSWFTSSCLIAFSLEGDNLRTLHQTTRQVAMPTWSTNGKEIAFLTSNYSDRGVVDGEIFVVSSEGGTAIETSPGHKSSTRYLTWSKDSKYLMTTGTEDGGMSITEIEVLSGKRESKWREFATISNVRSFVDDFNVEALVREDSRTPKDIWRIMKKGGSIEWLQLTTLNPHTSEISQGKSESVKWCSSDGTEIQGWFTFPVSHKGNGPYPLLVMPHGGPTGGVTPGYSIEDLAYEISTNGVAIFSPNFRGSTGFGLEFAEANIGDMGGMDWEDINSGIDYLIELGFVDPERIGIAGGSYGGYMSAWAITQTDRFKAAVPRAGIYDWRSFHGNSYLNGWEIVHYGGNKSSDVLELWEKFSPINYVERVTTPTLIVHGEIDLSCPVDGAYAFHRALKDLGVKTELIIYPREGHGIN